MALGAMSEYNTKNVKIVPVGLNYFNREKFRSEVIVNFGKPFTVPTEWAEEFKINKRQVTEKMLNEIELRMKSVTITANSYEEVQTLFLLRDMYIPKNMKLSPVEYSELSLRFSKGYKKLSELPDGDSFSKKANSYMNELNEIAVTDKEIRDREFKQNKLKRKFFLSLVAFILLLFFLLPGILILLPFIFYIRVKAEKERVAAKEKNPNKIKALDVVASVKVFQFVMCLPFIYLMFMLFFYYFSSSYLYFFYDINCIVKLIIGSVVFPFYFYSKSY